MQIALLQRDLCLDHEYAVVYARLPEKCIHYRLQCSLKSATTIFSAVYELGVNN